jgi:methylated-DNA-[protein]-cysteine S-methyltransferase
MTKSAAPNLHRLAPVRAAEERSRDLATTLGDLAADRGTLDVAIGSVGTPLGDLLIAVTPRGLVRLVYLEGGDRDSVLADLAARVSPRLAESAKATAPWRRELDEYFAHERSVFGDLRIDRRLMKPFARKVLTATARVPFGEVTTYGELADRIGHPRAARAVGTALGSNPIPIVVPCHRVVRAGGDLGGYTGGPERKVFLLRLEGGEPR